MHRWWLPALLISPLACVSAAPAGTGLPSLPEPVTNNAVAVVTVADREYVVSLLGLGPAKTWRDLRAGGHRLRVDDDRWTRLPDVPDGRGRVAAVAATVGESVYVFGGYTIAADGAERSLPHVYRLDVVSGTYERRADMPVPVDDSVALVHRDRYVYLVSGWHDTDNVPLVQLYDTVDDRWQHATAWPGAPVFGHAGAIDDGRLLVCDGVRVAREPGRPKYAPSDECWLGDIDATDPATIAWRRIDPHPGPPRYRMAGLFDDGAFLFAGGSANPYNYDGIGYDRQPSEPQSDLLMFDPENNRWSTAPGPAAMDLRALVRTSRGLLIVGGMRARQEVSAEVIPIR